MNKQNIKTEWNFKIFKVKSFSLERILTLKRVNNFYRKWQGVSLAQPVNLSKFLQAYEKLISTPPGIFDQEYLYYLLKGLLNTKNKKIKLKLDEIKKLRQECNDKIFSLLDFLKDTKKREKILKAKILKTYKNFLEDLFKPSPKIETNEIKEMAELKEKIGNEIKKHKKRIFEDEHLQEKILKKYAKLGERAINKTLENYKEFFPQEINSDILKIIKKHIIKNRKTARQELEKLSQKEKDLDQFLAQKISFNQALQLTIEFFENINKNFGKLILNYFQKGLIDVYPKKNKYLIPRNIAPSFLFPPFILLNFENNIKSLLNLVYELGHAIHTHYLRKNNSPLNTKIPGYLRETLALFFEFLFLENLMKKFDKKLIEIWLIKLKINYIFYNGVLFLTIENLYNYYKKLKYVPLKIINQTYKKNLEFIFGKNEAEKSSEYKWLLYFYKGLFWHLPYLVSGFIAENIVAREINPSANASITSRPLVKSAFTFSISTFISFIAFSPFFS